MCSTQETIPPTQFPDCKRTRANVIRDYSILVLFNWGEGIVEPFKVYNKNVFDTSEIRDEWLRSQLVPKSRFRKLKPTKAFGDQKMSIFAKIETGT